jgi:uncharacterized membrane protein
MLSVITNFTPYRLKLRKKEPVQLIVQIKNSGNDNRIVSMQLALSRQLSLDKSGINSGIEKKLGEMKPGESKKFYYDVYAKQLTDPGEYPIILKVMEHYRSYDFVEKEYKKKMSLVVEE